MSLIKIDVEKLNATSKALNVEVKELVDLCRRLDILINSIDDSWDGKSSEVYVKSLKTYYKDTKSIIEIVSRYRRMLDTTASTFDFADQTASAILNSIFFI